MIWRYVAGDIMTGMILLLSLIYGGALAVAWCAGWAAGRRRQATIQLLRDLRAQRSPSPLPIRREPPP